MTSKSASATRFRFGFSDFCIEKRKRKEKLPISIKYENRRAYYDAFAAYHTMDDIVPMLEIFVERERQRLTEYLNILGA